MVDVWVVGGSEASSYYFFFIFFFQAEDGIRDTSVTGVQTCALPIYNSAGRKALLNVFVKTGNGYGLLRPNLDLKLWARLIC